MSPLTVRRYRAERLLREEFEGLRARVIKSVRSRLAASGVYLDTGDLEACYGQAWQGLYAAVLEGQEIANPAGWLVIVTLRRCFDEQRARARAQRAREGDRAGGAMGVAGEIGRAGTAGDSVEPDLAAELDDRARLRQLFEALRSRLSEREREAAALCYLQGLSRSQAAARLGVSEARMRKLMEGRGPRDPGVAGKVGALIQTIREGGWCEEQGSLMRGLAFGILDPDGERHQLALAHCGACPSCRAYVASLRGLAAVLPPVLAPWGLGAGALARLLGLGHAGAPAGAGTGAAGGGAMGAGSQVGRALTPAVSASGAAGAGGAAGGGWLLATGGPLGAKLAVGCVLALGVGAGCVALSADPGGHASTPSSHQRAVHSLAPRTSSIPAGSAAGGDSQSAAGASGSSGAAAGSSTRSAVLSAAARASREFGPEQAGAQMRSVAGRGDQALAQAASSSSSSAPPQAPSSPSSSGVAEAPAPSPSKAEREFSPG